MNSITIGSAAFAGLTVSDRQTTLLRLASAAMRSNKNKARMWANAQRDGHPAQYRWRPVLNPAVS